MRALALWLALLVAVAPRPSTAAGEVEPNDTIGTAVPIGAGTITGHVHAGDDDYFRIELGNDQALEVELDFVHAAGDLELKVLTPDGVVRASGISTTDDEYAYFYPAGGGVDAPILVIWVYGYLGAANSYTFEARLLDHGGLPQSDDALEENDDPANAVSLPLRGTFEGLSFLDEDWFRFTAREHETVRAELSFRDAKGDIDVELLDATQEVVAAATSASDNELLIAEYLPAGDYWLRVFTEAEGATNFYDLSIERATPAGPERWVVEAASEWVTGAEPDAARHVGTVAPAREGNTAGWAHRGGIVRTLPSAKVGDPIVPGEFLVKWASVEARDAFEASAGRAPWTTRRLVAERNNPGVAESARRQSERAAFAAHPAMRWSWMRQNDVASMRRPLAEQLKDLAALPGVEAVEPNRLWSVPGEFVDNATNRGGDPPLDLSALLDLPSIHARERGDGMLIAVIDTGLLSGLPAFDGAVWTNDAELAGAPGIDDDGNGYVDDTHGWDFVSVDASVADPLEDTAPPDNDPADFHGHGSAVSGVAVGRAAAAPAGIAPEARVMALRAGFALPSGQGVLATADWVEAVAYAAAHGADVINMSFAGHENSAAAADVCAWAASRGCLLIAAAGNESFFFPRYPAAFPGVIAVGSVNPDGSRSSFSNFGAWVDLVSFGDGVPVPALDGGVASARGTSFSAPAVAGLMALAKATTGRSPAEIVERLRLASRDPYLANPAFAGQLGAGWPHAGDFVSQLADEESGRVARFLIRNDGLTPAILQRRQLGGVEIAPLLPAGDITTEQLQSGDRSGNGERLGVSGRTEPLRRESARVVPRALSMVEVFASDESALVDALPGDGSPLQFELVAGDDFVPPALAFMRQITSRDFAAVEPFPALDTQVAWRTTPFATSPLAPWTPGSFAWGTSGEAILRLAAGPSLVIAQRSGFRFAAPAGLHRIVANEIQWPADPNTDLRLRAHSDDWNAMTSAWSYGTGLDGEAIVRPASVEAIVVAEPTMHRWGWNAGLDLLRSGGEASPADEAVVGAVRLEAGPPVPPDSAWRLEYLETPDLSAGWTAVLPTYGGTPPAQAFPIAFAGPWGEAGVGIFTATNQTQAGFVESPPLVLEAGRLYRIRFTVAADDALAWEDYAPVQLYAWRGDRRGAWSRLIEALPGRTGPTLSPAPTSFDLFFRTPAAVTGELIVVRAGAGLSNHHADDATSQTLYVTRMEVASVSDPWSD